MANIPFGNGDWGSVDENIARVVARNIYLSENPTNPDGVSRMSRPALFRHLEIGPGTIYGMWQESGSLNGDWFVVSGETLNRVDRSSMAPTSIGPLPGAGYVDIAGSRDRVVFVRSGAAWSSNGGAITQIVMPDSLPVGAVAFINGMFLLSVQNSDKIFWMLPGEASPASLHFVTDERSADAVVSMQVISDEIWVLGETGVNVYQDTGDDAARIQRIPGRAYSEGCASRATAVQASVSGLPCALWVTDTRSVVMSTGSPDKISTRSEEELLKEATNLRAWNFRASRDDFYVITADEFTLVYSITRKEWYRWDSYGFDNWRAHLGFQVGQVVYAGDGRQGVVWRLEDGEHDDGQPIVRETTGIVLHTKAEGMPCDSVDIAMSIGWSPSYDVQPKIELSYSDDGGWSWTDQYQQVTGFKGRYDGSVIFRSLGTISRPGRYFKVRYSEKTKFRMDYGTMNEA